MPPHVSGRPDYLPFADFDEVLAVFDTLRLPSSYFQIANGTPGSVHSHTYRDSHNHPIRYYMIAHCISKQGDWAIALSHDAAKMVTSVFWSLDAKIDQHAMIGDLHEFRAYVSHPMLIPCIMFAANLRMSEQRRHSIKDGLQTLESRIGQINGTKSFSCDHKDQANATYDQPLNLEAWLGLLQSCRQDQVSRKGKSCFWQSFVDAMEEGFSYYEQSLPPTNATHLLQVHKELKSWVALIERNLESLMARDEDHACRLDNVSHMVWPAQDRARRHVR